MNKKIKIELDKEKVINLYNAGMNNIILCVIFICFVGIFVFVLTRNISNDLHDLNSKIDKIVIFLDLDLNVKEVSE